MSRIWRSTGLGGWSVVPERPQGTVRVAHIQEAVRARLDAKGWDTDRLEREIVDTLVWETMAVLGEWQFVDLELPPGEPDSATDVEGSS